MDELRERHEVPIAGKHVLDIGSGVGYYIEYFQQFDPAILYGIDLTEASKQYLEKQFPGGTFFTADLSDPVLPVPGQFDVISAMGGFKNSTGST
jgi:SAM-dependent methyltransferase